MPFRSERQRRFMHANHPDIAERWEREAKEAKMAGPAGKKGIVKRRFGKTGKPVNVSAKTDARARKLGTKLYEDNTYQLPKGQKTQKRR